MSQPQTVYFGVGDVARTLNVRPSQITQLFYERRLRDDLCPIVSGRRLIPLDYVDIIVMELKRKGIEVCDRGDSAERAADRAEVVS